MLERARDSLAHQRIHASRVARQNHPAMRVSVARVEPSNRKRIPLHRPPDHRIEWKFRKRRRELSQHPRLLSPLFREVTRPLIIDADIEMRSAIDRARERPCVAADPTADASEVEAISILPKLNRLLRIHRNIRHQRAPCRFLTLAKHASPHPAPRSIRTNQHLGFKSSAPDTDPHAIRVLPNLDDPLILDDFEPRARRRPRKHRVKPIPPNNRTKHVAPARQINAPNRRLRPAANNFNRWLVERDTQLLEREHSLGNQPTRTNLESRMRPLLDRNQKIKRRRQPRWSRPRNHDRTIPQASHHALSKQIKTPSQLYARQPPPGQLPTNNLNPPIPSRIHY